MFLANLRSHREVICSSWSPQFVVSKDHIIFEVTMLRLQRGYLQPTVATVRCDRRLQHLKSHCCIQIKPPIGGGCQIGHFYDQIKITNRSFCGHWPPKFVVAKGYNIFEVTERLFAAGDLHSLLWSKATTFDFGGDQAVGS